MNSAKKLRHLRFPLILAVSIVYCLFLTVFAGRLFGCPVVEEDESWHSQAQNAAIRAMNSKFALTVIQALLDTSVNNYQSVL